MAETHQETGLLDGTVSHALCDDSGVVDSTHVQTDNDGMSEELLRQALANAFDSSNIYAVATDEAEVCDTGQDPACVSSSLGVSAHQDVIVTHMPSNTEAGLVSTSEVMNGTYTVDVGSLPEGHIISLPNDIISGSVIIAHSNEEQFQTVIEGSDETQILQDETHQLVQQIEPQFVQQSEAQLLQTDNTQLIQNDNFTQPHSITVSTASGITMTQEVLQNVIQQVQAQQLAQQQAAAQKKQPSSSGSAASQNTVSFTLVSPSQQSANSPPLGSSQNPIRIIQQGNRYTPMQQLTPEQLHQIMQVVQQQHVNKNTQENGGAVIFNPQTNTRIMYRVIYPSELHKTQNAAGHTTYQVVRPATSSQEQQTGTSHQKRQYRKRKDVNQIASTTGGEEDKEKGTSDTAELSKEEKEERKKHRPRTRSGRVSKPPKHMVQDYKHIHVLDWDEDYDDSDGGYSDFKHSDEEGKAKQEGEEEHSASPEFFQALGAGRPKNHKCQNCDKSYIGQAGLARHYRLNPDHCTNPTENGSISSLHNGSLDGEDSKDASLLQDGSSSRMSDSAAEMAKVSCNSIENFSEDSNTQDSLNSTGATSPVVRRGRGRGGFRGRWAHLKQNAQIRRKNKLKELMKQCTDEDLMEVVLPRLVSTISVWEYLMMKSEKGGARPQVDVIYHEFETLKHHVKQACADYMEPLTQEELVDDNLQCKMIKVSDKSLGLCLNLEPITYRVKEMPPGDSNSFSSLHNKLSAAAVNPFLDTASLDKLLDSRKENGAVSSDTPLKRPLTLASQEQIDGPPSKRVTVASSSAAWNHVPTIIPSSASTYTVATGMSAGEEKGHYARSDSALSTIPLSTVILPQSLSVSSQSSHISSATILSSSKSSSTSTSVRSPFIHISCPTTKQQPTSYILAGPRKPSPVSSRTSKTQSIPIIINQSVGTSGSTAQVLPYVMGSTGSSAAGLQQKVIVAAPGKRASQPGTVVLAIPNSQKTGNATVLLTSPSPTTGHRVIVRQPPQTVQSSSRVVLTHQPSPSKSPKATSSLTLSMPATAVNIQAPTTNSSSRSLLGKPTEVRVSRQLFHDTTSPSMSSLTLTNGHSAIKTSAAPSLEMQPVFQQLPVITTAASTSFPLTVFENGVSSNGKVISTRAGNNKTLITPPSGQQFIASPNKTETGQQLIVVADVDDLSVEVLSSLEFSGDDLGPLNTSSDSLNGSLPSSTHLTDSVMTVSSSICGSASFTQTQAAVDSGSLVASGDMVHAAMSDSQTYEILHNGSINGSEDVTLINGSSPEFSNGSSLKTKDGNIINQASSLASSISSLSTSDFISLTSKPSTSFITSMSKDSPSFVQSTTYHIGTNGALSSQVLKSDLNSTSSIMMTDMSGLSFTDQVTHVTDTVSSHLNGISPLLSSDDAQENAVSILQDQISGSETQELDNQILDAGEVTMTDGFSNVEDGQLLLSEGTSIYQREDGTLIVQSINGNTYQLHGAQGLSLETVQALLSTTFDQLVSGDVTSDAGGQMNVQLH